MRSILAAILICYFACQPVAAQESSDISATPLRITAGVRFSFTDNPGYFSDTGNWIESHRARVLGAQVGLTHEDHFQLGVGYERLLTSPYWRSQREREYPADFTIAGWFVFLSPGFVTQFERGEALSIGTNIDVGLISTRIDREWLPIAREGLSVDSSSSSIFRQEPYLGGRVGAIRPKVTLSHQLWQNVAMHAEAGWMWATFVGATPAVYAWDPYAWRRYFVSHGIPYSIDFTGPTFAVALTISAPFRFRKQTRPFDDGW